MTYAHIVAGDIVQTGSLPRTWYDGTRWHDWRYLSTSATDPADYGWYPVTDTPRPTDTELQTHERSVQLVAGVPTVVWTPRPWTPEELATRAAQQVQEQLATDTTADLGKLEQAIKDLATLLGDNTTAGSIRSWKAPITNNSTLTGAQGKQLADLLISEAQATRRIARQTLRLARSMVGDYSSADVGTE